MTEEHLDRAPLPAARSLDRAAQMRLIGLCAAAALGLAALVAVVHWLTTPAPVRAAATPPGTFRPTPEQLSQLTIAPASSGAVADIVRATGAIAVDADRSTPIVLPFSGQVTDVLVEPGQQVVVGQPLLRVASADLVDARNALLTATAQTASTAEAVRVAEANARRQQAIVATAGGAPKDYQAALADLANARAAANSAQAAAQAARNKLALFGEGSAAPAANGHGTAGVTYRAPAAGVIVDRNVAPGQYVGANGATPLMTITDPARVWLVAQLSESDAAAVHLGDAVTVTTPALPGRSFAARIDNIAAALDPATHRLPVRASVANPGDELKPQMFASFVIRRLVGGGVDDGVLVPAAAVIHEGDIARLWILRRDGLLEGRRVVAGETEGGLTRIVSGLAPGERVVTGGALFVNEAGLGG